MRNLLLPLLVVACSSSPSAPGADAGDEGEGSVATIEGGTGCATDKSPKEDACVVDEKYGVFVSASLGSASGDGSRTSPLKTIQAGIDLAKATKRNVYVCAESYNEQLTLANAVHAYGYMDCNNGWKAADARALVSNNAVPIARADGAAQTTRIEGFELRAPDVSATPKASSIAIVLVASSGVRFSEMTIHADNAGKGTDGTDAVQLTDSGAGKNGVSGGVGFMCNPQQFSCNGGPAVPAAVQNTCTGKMGITPGVGGTGGVPSLYTRTNGAWVLTTPAGKGAAQPGNMSTAQGGIPNGSSAQNGAAGMDGMMGNPGDDGFIDAMKLFVNGDGTAGADGQPGQGGGGGAGYDSNPGNISAPDGNKAWGNAGGSGGAGGCPGLAATIGTGGGASIAILAIDSPFTISKSKIETGKGGDGGKAGVASTSTLGGTGGSGNNTLLPGGNGGSGGFAGASGNGSGGPSIGVAYRGVSPTINTDAMITPGTGGKGVPQRLIIDIKVIAASPDGMSAATHLYGA